MKKYGLFALVFCICFNAHAQLTLQHGSVFTVGSGARVQVGKDLTSNTDLPGGTIVMNGSTLQHMDMNGFAISNLEINNSNDVALQTSSIKINNSLAFINGRIQAGAQDLILGNGATVTGVDASKFIVTNGTGHLVSNVAAANTIFPVGATAGSYTPVTLSNAGTADNFSVRVIPGVLTNGTSGSPLTEKAINRTWLIEEGTAGGSNATVGLQWNMADELPNFTAGTVYLSHYTNNQWDITSRQPVTYTANVAKISRSNITSFSPFSVNSTAGGSISALQLLPNPVKDILYVQAIGDGPAALYVTDAIGRKVREQKVVLNGAGSYTIDVANLASGMYVLVLDMESGKWEQKFLKK